MRIRFLGFPKHHDFEAGIIVTRERNFLDRDFIFEVLVTFVPDLREYAPYLNSKNSTLFLGGTGTIVATRLKILP